MSLTTTSFKGASWLGFLKASIKILSLIKLTIIARILSPTDFGLFAMIVIPFGLLEVASEPGFKQALIQTKKPVRKYFSSAWLAFSLRGLILFLILFFSADLISSFYRADLTRAIRIIALSPLLKGLGNPAIVLFQKKLKFKKQFVYQFLMSLTESVFTIFYAIKLKSMLALPLGVVAGAVSNLILSYFLAKVDFSKIKISKIFELYRYGKWVTVGTLLSYLNDQSDDLLVGKVLGAQPLGWYQTAYKISNLPTTQGASLIYQVVFPIFSSIQNDFERLKRGVIKSLIVTFILSLLFGLGIYTVAPSFTRIVLGSQWLPMIPALNVLIIFGIARPLVSVGSAFFDAVGKPKVPAVVNMIKLIVILSLIYPFTIKFGIIGTAWVVVIAQLSVYPWFIFKLIKALG